MSTRAGKYYGDVLTSYSGRGKITNSVGNKFDCDFEAHQLATGRVVLLAEGLNMAVFQNCLDISAFSGTETGGPRISWNGNIRETGYLPERPNSSYGVRGAFYLDQLHVDHGSPYAGLRVFKFGLTNLEFIGTPKPTRRGWHSDEITLDLDGSDIGTIRLQRIRGYNDRIKRLKTLRGVQVTAELISPPLPAESLPQLKQVVADLCYILSIASGTKVQWLYCIETTRSRRKITTNHYSRITKPFSALAPIDLDQPGVVKGFVEQVYPVYAKRRFPFELEKGTVDAYLDAKVETDFLEMRGAKMAVAIEALKQTFLDMPGSQNYELVLPEDIYAPIIEDIQKEVCRLLKEHGVMRRKAKTVATKGSISGLNRRPFEYVLLKLCKSIDLNLGPDTDLFIASRNSLVHRGRFYSKSANLSDRARIAPPSTARDEYFFLVNVMDRLYLRLIGYSGPYINWREPGSPRNNALQGNT